MDAIASIKQKLQAYRKKFYLNRMIRGGVILLLLLSSLFIGFVVFEAFLWLSPGVRTALFYTLLASAAGVAGAMIIYPATKYFAIGPSISDEEAARLIGKHFPEVDDKLLNLLQLNGQSTADDALLRAAIEQKTAELQPVPFAAAVNLQPNWRLARWIGVPIGILLLLLAINPAAISDGTLRFLRYNEHFNPPPPFRVKVPNHPKELVDGNSHTINIQLSGNELPGELYIYIKKDKDLDFQRYSLDKENTVRYQYTFKNVHQNFAYYIGNELHGSGQFKTQILKRPSIGNFYVVLNYPNYTGRATDTLTRNVGDFSALQGTQATWYFQFKGPVEKARVKMGENYPIRLSEADLQQGQFSKQLMEPTAYTVLLQSARNVQNADTIQYNIEIVPDKYPSVTIRQPAADIGLPRTGIVPLEADFSDDYGFSRAAFFYRFTKSDDPTKLSREYRSENLQVPRGENLASIFRKIDFFRLGAEQGDEIEYFVRVWDNDAVNGAKSATSTIRKITYRSVNDQYDEINQTTEEINRELNEMFRDAKENFEQLEQVRESLLNKQNLSYEDRRQLQEVMQKQQQLQRRMQELSQKMEEKQQAAEQNELFTEQTQEKLEKLREMMEEMADTEAMKRLQEMQERLRNMNRQQMQNELENMEDQQKQMEENIERTMELLRQLQVDEKVQEMIRKLEEMKQRQEMLQDRLEGAQTPEERQQTQQKQEELRGDMQQLQQDLQELSDLKQQTRTPDPDKMEELQQMNEEIQQEMNKAGQQMQQGKKGKAGQSQQNAREKMEQMQEQLTQMQMDTEMEQAMENYEDLRALLENLITLSFDEEALRDELKSLNPRDPTVVEVARKQDKISEDFEMLEDSLRALAQRTMEIEQFVMEEVQQIRHNLRKTKEHLDEDQTAVATSKQHSVMTGLNRLANMLVESLDQMQQQMRQMQGMSGACKKPGSSNPSMQQLSKQQQQLNQQLQQMMNQMKQGQQNGQGQMQKLQQMAEEQARIRQQLQEMYKRLQENGEEGGLGNLGNISDQMQDSEEEMRNKELTQELLMRQQQILNRMLDYDKAMREREFDNQREGQQASDYENTPPAELEEEELEQRIRREQFSRNKYRYTPTYRDLIDQYYQLLGKQQ